MIKLVLSRLLPLACLTLVVSGCQSSRSYVLLVTATAAGISTPGTVAEPDNEALPIASPLAQVDPGSAPTPTFIPTPNPTRASVINATEEQIYIVQRGDTLGTIAQRFGVSIESLVATNNIVNENVLEVGQALTIPLAIVSIGPSFKTIPDSELVFGPAAQGFDTATFLTGYNSYLSIYSEEVDGDTLTGVQIIERVALEQSINPRLLLALLEFESGWITQSVVTDTAAIYPLNYRERPSQVYGLYSQLDWAAKHLQTGYYGWRQRGLSAALLVDGTRVGLNPTINAGTAGIQVLLAQTRTFDAWQASTLHTGLFRTYVSLFGDPFQYAVEPLIPPDLQQPTLGFPWPDGQTWYYTGGPHGGWGTGSAWGALDFVQTTETLGCDLPTSFAGAVADGVIAVSEKGIVVLDLDGDGFEGTGWTIFYLHISSIDRQVTEGQRVRRGDPIGKPSCEGGVSYSSHLHIARRYNGEWIAADCTSCPLEVPAPPFVLNGWQAYSFGPEYDGSLIMGDDYREACTCREAFNALFGSPP